MWRPNFKNFELFYDGLEKYIKIKYKGKISIPGVKKLVFEFEKEK